MHIDYCKIRILLTVCIFRLNISQIDIYIFVQVNYFERNKISGGSQRDTPPQTSIIHKNIYIIVYLEYLITKQASLTPEFLRDQDLEICPWPTAPPPLPLKSRV